MSFRSGDDGSEPLLSPAVTESESEPFSPSSTLSQTLTPFSNGGASSPRDVAKPRPPVGSYRTPSQYIAEIVDEENYRLAAVHVVNAFRNANDCEPRRAPGAHFAHLLYVHLRFLFNYVVFFLVVMAFFEAPLWCRRDYAFNNGDKCKNQTSMYAYYPMSGIPILNVTWNFGLELGLLLLLVVEVMLQLVAYGFKKFFTNWQMVINALLLLCYVVEFAYNYISPFAWLRFAQYIRILMFVNRSEDVRQQVRLFTKILPRFLAIAFIVFLYITAFAFIGVLLLKDYHWNFGTFHDYFNTMGHAYWALMVMLTTCNYPDVAIQAYTLNRVTFLFYLAFSIGGIFFLVNFATAIVYNAYLESDEQEREKLQTQEEANLRKAFNLMDEEENNYITYGQFLELSNHMRKYRGLLPQVKGEFVKLMFAVLDFDGSQVLTFENFRMLMSVLRIRFERIEEETYLERKYPAFFKSPFFQTFKNIVLSVWFEYGMMLILLIMGIFTVWESWDDIINGYSPNPKRTDNKLDSFWNFIELIFTVIFVVEATVKILALGWKRYWRQDTFEFFVAVLSVVVTIIIYVPNNFNDTVFIRYTLLLRLLQALQLLSAISAPGILRLMRLLTTIRYFQLFYLTVVNMIPPVVKLTKMLFCMMFFYSCLGVDIYGGLITRDPNNKNFEILQNTDYGRAGYYAMNMNDMASAMVVFFEMLIVNNWHLFVSGFVAVTSFWTYYFFISFFALGVIMGLNIVVAFVIDTFQREYEAQQRTLEVVKGAAMVEKDEAVFDASIITGTRTGLTGLFRAQVVGKLDSRTKQDLLLKLFEQKLGINVNQMEEVDYDHLSSPFNNGTI
eukprot:TRINITY_DN2233_c0_g1_i2.p1 TRINITY_DN2233_c0_g1~~TRINITY_DN2233_c0_g1_i2.p1  ORF type:complete len:944 (-),score=76.29 TRINITY_DN2233_c0_g1_i2:3939-6458(-)